MATKLTGAEPYGVAIANMEETLTELETAMQAIVRVDAGIERQEAELAKHEAKVMVGDEVQAGKNEPARKALHVIGLDASDPYLKDVDQLFKMRQERAGYVVRMKVAEQRLSFYRAVLALHRSE